MEGLHPLLVERSRTAGAIAALIERRLAALDFGPGPDPLREALVHIGARYGEILVAELNEAPSRWREAFSGLLGLQPAPALAAHVLLSFQPVASRMPVGTSIVVPAHTEVAAPPPPGDSDPVVFETLSDLTLLRAQPLSAVAVDPQRLASADATGWLSGSGCASALALLPVGHALHLGLPTTLGAGPLSRLCVELDVMDAGTRAPQATITWGLATPRGFVPLGLESDTTMQLRRSGMVTLLPPAQWPAHALEGIEACWLSCRLSPGDVPLPDGDRFAPPRVSRLRVIASTRTEPVAPEAVFFGAIELDRSKAYPPFGERPRFGDVFHLAAPAFAQPGARVTLSVRLTNPAGADDGPIPPVRREGKPRVAWEIHTRRGWTRLDDASDGTRSFTQDGSVDFVVPPDAMPTTIAGRDGAWVRAQLVSGHYGAPQTVDGMVWPAAPSIAALTVRSEGDIGPLEPALLMREGLFGTAPVPPGPRPLEVFPPVDLEGPALLLGLMSLEDSLQGRETSLLVDPLPAPGRIVWRDAPGAGEAAPRWQMLTAAGWLDCEASDDSRGLTRTGLIRLRLPHAPSPWPGCRFDPLMQLTWLRAVWPTGTRMPALRRLALNSVRARQSQRLRNEILGSSTGRAGQTFRALRTPIVGEIRLEVREEDDGPWVPWQRVPDFDASDAGARHYTLDPASGRIRFGDGLHGRIPPPGPSSIRLHEYHVGGGRRGNRPPGTITQLRSAIPYVEGVTHWVPATGGQDASDAHQALSGAGAWLRHRDRAICASDYADLARAASRDVARAWCHGWGGDALPAQTAASLPGAVGVVVVPRSEAARPQPGPDLLALVKAHLDARRPPAAELVVMGPDYASVSVRVQLQCLADASPHEVTRACRQRLEAFLHPLDGGAHGQGWSPGERPHRSDLVAQAAAVEGVDHVASLTMRIEEPAIDAPGAALACAGEVEVTAS